MLRGGRRSVFLNIRSRVSTDGEGGLLSLAFDPRYERNRRFYVYFVDRAGAVVISSFRAAPGGNRAQRGSGRRILRLPHPATNHKGGQIQFGR